MRRATPPTPPPVPRRPRSVPRTAPAAARPPVTRKLRPARAARRGRCRDGECACPLRSRRLRSNGSSATSRGHALPSRRLNAEPRAAFVTRGHLRGSAYPHWARGPRPRAARSVERARGGQYRSPRRRCRKASGGGCEAGGSARARVGRACPLPCPPRARKGFYPKLGVQARSVRHISCLDSAPGPVVSRETQLGRLSCGIHRLALYHV